MEKRIVPRGRLLIARKLRRLPGHSRPEQSMPEVNDRSDADPTEGDPSHIIYQQYFLHRWFDTIIDEKWHLLWWVRNLLSTHVCFGNDN